jgi:PAS domain S-box-containing protein
MKIPNLVNSVFFLIVCVLGAIMLSPFIMPGERTVMVFSSALIAATFGAIIYASARIDKMNKELENKISNLNEEKKRVEELMEQNSEMESSLTSLISLFIAPNNVDRAIDETLQRTGTFCNSECNCLVMLGKNRNSFHIQHKWAAPNLQERKAVFENLSESNFPWLMEQIRNNAYPLLLESASLPKAASREMEIMHSRGVSSLIIVPTEIDRNIVGFIAIENPSLDGTGYKEQLPALKILSELTGMFLQHKLFLENLSLFKNLINESNDFIFVIDPCLEVIIDVNETACSELGYSRDEFLSMGKEKLERIFCGRFWEQDIRDICGNRFLDIDRTMIRKNNTVAPVEMNVTFTTHENNNYALAIVRDITKRKEVEEILRRTQERVELALKGADLGMWDWNIKNNELIYNDRWAEMLGYEPRDIKPSFDSWKKLMHPDDLPCFMKNIGLHLKNEVLSFESEFRMHDKRNASWRWILARGKLVERNGSGDPLRLAGTTMDISERKQFEEDLRKSNELKDLFTDIMRHDLLNPAGNIKGYSDLLLETEASEKQKILVSGIKRNNDKLIEMIETAAKFAKLESVENIQLEIMDIGTILRNVVEQFDQKLYDKQMNVVMRASGTYHSLVNPIVEEIFANFISNAIKYSPEDTDIIIDVIDSNYQWKVEVTDQGEGIPDELKAQVFERFKRAHKKGVKGTGLGLAIVKRIAEIMEGEVGVEDNPAGNGSVFWAKFRKCDHYTETSLSISDDEMECVSDLPAKRKLLVH